MSRRTLPSLFDGDELYDLREDPYETNNLINNDEYSGVLDELRRRVIEHVEQTGDNDAVKLAHALKLGR